MSEPYLVVHKVRGQPAFDIAEKMPCPVCEGARQGLDDFSLFHCDACADTDGYWWIIPTSGHRAYPYWTTKVDDLFHFYGFGIDAEHILSIIPAMPDEVPDHYPTPAAPKGQGLIKDLGAMLGLIKPQAIKRRV